MKKIKVGICGYGNLGKSVESEIDKNEDMELIAIFTRRASTESFKVKSNVPVVHVDSAIKWKENIDVMILCDGSTYDLPKQAPQFASMFTTVDSFDTHATTFEYWKSMDNSSRKGNNLSIISIGWDPGIFSIMRLFSNTISKGYTNTFYGKGVSQAHSNAIRSINGVIDAIQYTIPNEEIMEKLRKGDGLNLTNIERHRRLCYVVAHETADKKNIIKEIKEIPNYFLDYDVTVNFINIDEFNLNHRKLLHRGNVIHSGKTGNNEKHIMELSLELDSNSGFTASTLLAYTRAAYKLFVAGERGAKTIFDIPPILLSNWDRETILINLL